MSSYNGFYAEIYDLLYNDKPYADEALFVHSTLQKYQNKPVNKILELACGTGNHAFELEKYGYDIFGIDWSEDMLFQARRKASLLKSKIQFSCQDMCGLDLKNKKFDAVLCLFDSIGYVQKNDAIYKVLCNVYDYLGDNGLFIFEFWHATPMLKSYDPVRIKRLNTGQSLIIRISETTLDCLKQTAIVSYQIIKLNNDGSYYALQETQGNRFFLVQEMVGLLTHCGFLPLEFFSGFQEGIPITEDSWHIVAIAKKNQSNK
jgi:SAM-dependent methyltransferase